MYLNDNQINQDNLSVESNKKMEEHCFYDERFGMIYEIEFVMRGSIRGYSFHFWRDWFTPTFIQSFQEYETNKWEELTTEQLSHRIKKERKKCDGFIGYVKINSRCFWLTILQASDFVGKVMRSDGRIWY